MAGWGRELRLIASYWARNKLRTRLDERKIKNAITQDLQRIFTGSNGNRSAKHAYRFAPDVCKLDLRCQWSQSGAKKQFRASQKCLKPKLTMKWKGIAVSLQWVLNLRKNRFEIDDNVSSKPNRQDRRDSESLGMCRKSARKSALVYTKKVTVGTQTL